MGVARLAQPLPIAVILRTSELAGELHAATRREVGRRETG